MGGMVSQHTTSSRARLVARSRLYLAAVVTGGVAAGAGFAVAAARADAPAAPTTPVKHTVARHDGHRAGRTPPVRRGQAPTTSVPAVPDASSTPSAPVRSAPSQQAQPDQSTQSTQSQRAGSSHAS